MMRKYTYVWRSWLPWMFVALFAFMLTSLTMGCPSPTSNESLVETQPEKTTESTPEEPASSESTPEEPASSESTPEEPVSNPEEAATPEESATPEEKAGVEPVKEADGSSQEAAPEPTNEGSPEVITEPTGPDPVVKITEPAANAVLTGRFTLKVDATVGGGLSIDRVEVYVDNSKIDEKATSPFEFDINSSAYEDGDRRIKAIAFSTGLKQGLSELTVKFSNKGPKIAFVKPSPSSAVSAAFDVEVTVADPAGVKTGSVKLNVDGTTMAWTSSANGVYKATVNPSGKPYDSLPMEVVAENNNNLTSSAILWVSHDPAPGPKTLGQECNNADAQQRCIVGHSCLLISFVNPKSVCYKNCVVGGPLTVCPIVPGKSTQCEPAQTGTTRGACLNADRPTGTLFSKCGGAIACNQGMVCTGAGTGDSFCLQSCPASDYNKPCATQGYQCLRTTSSNSCTTDAQCPTGLKCVSGKCETGVCVERCQGTCTTDKDCVAGQTCTNGTCSTPYCISYGACRSISGVGSICI